jgi:hypothetical protein
MTQDSVCMRVTRLEPCHTPRDHECLRNAEHSLADSVSWCGIRIFNFWIPTQNFTSKLLGSLNLWSSDNFVYTSTLPLTKVNQTGQGCSDAVTAKQNALTNFNWYKWFAYGFASISSRIRKLTNAETPGTMSLVVILLNHLRRHGGSPICAVDDKSFIKLWYLGCRMMKLKSELFADERAQTTAFMLPARTYMLTCWAE